MASSDHPRSSEEAVYDIILPLHKGSVLELSELSLDANRIVAEVEVISTVIETFSELREFLPEYVIRITDCRLLDSIIEFCMWLNEVKDNKDNEMNWNIKKDRFLRLISSLVDDDKSIINESEYLSNLGLPSYFIQRFIPFMKILSNQWIHKDPMRVLNELEIEFNKTDVIVDLQKNISEYIEKEKKKDETSRSNNTQDSNNNNNNKKEVSNLKDHNKEISKVPIDISMIGVKTKVSKLSFANYKNINHQKVDQPKAINKTSLPSKLLTADEIFQKNLDEKFDKHDRKRFRTTINNFNSAIFNLKRTLSIISNSLVGSESNIESEIDTSTNDLRSNKVIGKNTRSNSINVNSKVTNSNKALSDIVIDLGVDPRQKSRSFLSPFNSIGIYFIVESYLPPLENNDEPDSSSRTDVNLSKRRHKGMGGILAEGGHYEHLINAYKKYFFSVGYQSNKQTSIVACGIRYKIESICSAIIKNEIRKKKLISTNLDRNGEKLFSLYNHSLDAIVVSIPCDRDTTTSANSAFYNNITISSAYYPFSPLHLHQVVTSLHNSGIRATGNFHRLHGINLPTSAQSICKCVGIPFLIIVTSDKDSSSDISLSGTSKIIIQVEILYLYITILNIS